MPFWWMITISWNQISWTASEIALLGKLISDIFRAINRAHGQWNGIWNDPIGLVKHIATDIFWKVGNYKQKNITHVDTKYKWEKIVAASTPTSPSPVVVKNWVSWHIICCAACLQKMMPHTVFWLMQTFCVWQIHWTFPPPCITSVSFVFYACPSSFSSAYFGQHTIYISRKTLSSGKAYTIKKRKNKWS